MYIKRLYLQLITKYFPSAEFVKPTGDGLLLIFPYTEKTLHGVAAKIISACFQCLNDFPKICEADPMINFDPPQRVGFGISRGPACRLSSGKDILDFSGHLLNLASRLMDLARPTGILIDGHFLKEVIPPDLQDKFETQDIYIRSVAEDTPRPVFYSKEHVQLPNSALSPIKSPVWKVETAHMTRKRLGAMPGNCSLKLKSTPISEDKVNVVLVYPNRRLPGSTLRQKYKEFSYVVDGNMPLVRMGAENLEEFMKGKKLKLDEEFQIEVQYVV
jgi:hypothetical protein